MRKSISLRGVAGILIWAGTIFSAVSLFAQDWQLSPLHSFGNPVGSANRPSSGLILGSDGKLYGTANGGGAHNAGAVFRSNRDGSGFETLYDFGPGEDGFGARGPLAGVLEASDGRLYGTTFGGGTNNGGTIYGLNRDGSGFQVLHEFDYNADLDDNAPDPLGELIEGADGMLYGTTRGGGSFDQGTVFRIAKDGSAFQVLHEFEFNSPEGWSPEAPLLLGSDGVLYGSTRDFNIDAEDYQYTGKIFKMNPDGSGYAVIHDFGAKMNDGLYPGFSLTEARDGWLYGTTLGGGAGQGGVVFKLRKTGSGYSVLFNFDRAGTGPMLPFGALRERSGFLYGITEYGQHGDAGAIIRIEEGKGAVRVMETFGDRSHDVQEPVGALAQDAQGNLYGGSMIGGLSGGGTIFRCSLNGTHQILHSFNATGGDGGTPDSPLSLGRNGALYGTTQVGGWFGTGTIYQENPDGSGYAVLQNLMETPVGVIADSTNNDLYLATTGTPSRPKGNLYRVTEKGKLKTLHSFRGVNHFTALPNIPLTSSDGMLYGLVSGADQEHNGFLYRIQKNGKKFQMLYAFTNQSGNFPPLIEGSDGMLYGMKPNFNPSTPGSAFKIAKDGTGFTVLHTFSVHPKFGVYTQPISPLVEGGDGFIYGVGADDSGSFVFRIDQSGENYQFTQPSVSGITGLTKGNDGSVYGISSFGSLFKIDTTSGGPVLTPLPTVAFINGVSGLVALPSGGFCGTIPQGGDRNIGWVFKLTPPQAQ
jgi:uncharacterized repeat protein (TIGR03803 family)